MPTVDQQRVRRTRTRLIAHDPVRALQGYTLFTPMFGDGTVYLVDMRGEVVHTWRLPHRPGLYGYLLDNGHLFYSGKVMADLERFEAWGRFKAGAALEVDWRGNVLWEINHPDHHHDARKLRNGNVILLCLRALPAELHARVKGGLPGSEVDGRIYADYLVEVTTRGEVVWEWRSWDHLDFETEVITPQDRREEWTHGNTVAELADGNVVVSFRNISTGAIIDRRTGAIAWKLGSPPLAQQHDPRPLPNGNLLIFDNGPHRRDHPRVQILARRHRARASDLTGHRGAPWLCRGAPSVRGSGAPAAPRLQLLAGLRPEQAPQRGRRQRHGLHADAALRQRVLDRGS